MKADDLPTTLSLAFERIRGFLELSLFDDAWRELNDVPLNARRDLGYRWMRIHACVGLDKTIEAAQLVYEFIREDPHDCQSWLFLAELTRQQGGPKLAGEVLSAALEHGEEPELRYELAVNLCQSGQISEAREELCCVLGRNPEFRKNAEDDPRFEALWDMFMEERE